MKLRTKKTKVLFLLTLLILFLFSGIFNSRFSKNIITNNNYLEFNEKDQIQINLSGFWNLTGSPIFIDDSDTNYNWSKTAAENDWCSGSGSWTDPYVIENVTIDGQGSGNCIEIKNSNTYFIVQNCSIYNSGSPLGNAGIKLDIVDNGKIINNNCSDNNYCGIHLWHSNNNTLSGNTANNNGYYGIWIDCGNKNTLLGNTMNFCGISLDGSLLELASHSIDDTNLVNNKPLYYYTNEVHLGPDNFTNVGQIFLINCCNSIISGINISDGSGIYLHYCVNNTLSGNNASNNNVRGIYLRESNNNTLSGNTANNNNNGIVLLNGDNNTLSGNTANNNKIGMILSVSNNNTLSGNTINNNSYGILLISNNNNNKIFLNNFFNNEINAEDNGINNKWDNGTIGNYWDNYDGVDANDDGIGDTPYLISGTAGSQDNFPIWSDGDEEIPEDLPIISFGNYYLLFTFITILSFIILEKRKRK
jgi:parallel beta-helix repeat protein